MNGNDFTFGEYVAKKRKEKGLLARELAAAAKISPEYICDIEKGRRTAVAEEILETLIRVLDLSEKETELMYDLAAIARNTVSADLPQYIMENELVRAAIRTAKKNKVPDEKWEQFISEIIRKE